MQLSFKITATFKMSLDCILSSADTLNALHRLWVFPVRMTESQSRRNWRRWRKHKRRWRNSGKSVRKRPDAADGCQPALTLCADDAFHLISPHTPPLRHVWAVLPMNSVSNWLITVRRSSWNTNELQDHILTLFSSAQIWAGCTFIYREWIW